MLLFGVCGVVGYLADIGWLMVVGGIGVVFYIFVWRSNVTTLAIDNQWKPHEVLALIKEGADIGARDKQGNTPLHIAGRCNKDVIALMLIHEGADVDAKNNAGNTPLHWAVRFNAKEVAEMLILAGAEVNSENKHGLTPLDRALAEGHFDLAQILLKNGSANTGENHEYP